MSARLSFYRAAAVFAGAALALCSAPVLEAETVSPAWTATYSTPGIPQAAREEARCQALDAQGNHIVAGLIGGAFGSDMVLVKFPAGGGAPLWSVTYNGPDLGSDEPIGVAVDAAGDVLLAARCGSSSGSDYLTYAAKYSGTDGSLVWSDLREGHAGFMAAAPDGGMVIANDSRTYRLSAAGTLLWERLPDPSQAAGGVPAVDAASGDVLVAYAVERTAPDGGRGSYIVTERFAAADGATRWRKEHVVPGKEFSVPYQMVLDAAGNALVCGSAAADEDGSGFLVMKCSGADGSTLWRHVRTGAGTPRPEAFRPRELASCIRVDAAGNAVAAGWVTGAGDPAGPVAQVVKYSPAGAVLWEKQFIAPPGYSSWNWLVEVDAAGDVYVPSISLPDDESGPVMEVLIKHAAADGAQLWRVDGPGAAALGFNAQGNPVFTGYDGGAYDIISRVHSAADGSQISRAVHAGQVEEPAEDRASVVLADAAGNVHVAGGSGQSTRTAKYSPAGVLLWESISPRGPFDSYERPVMALDAAGNVAVSRVVNNGGRTDWLTVRHAAGDGTVLWSKTFNGPVDGNDRPEAVATAANGDVIVTGTLGVFSRGMDSPDFMTIRYAAADGAEVWRKGFNGPGSDSRDQPENIAVDAAGDIFVHGTTVDPWWTYPAASVVLKYSASGNLLWRAEGPYSGLFDEAGGCVFTCGAVAVPVPGIKVVKHGADGGVAWTAHVPRPAGEEDFVPVSMAADAAGDVTVITASRVLKLDHAEGALRWMVRQPDPSTPTMERVVVDAAGNAFISSFQYRGNNRDQHITRRSGADGSVLWEYPGPGTRDHPRVLESLALDPAGGLLAAGASRTSDYGTDMLLLKLRTEESLRVAAQDGTVIPNGGSRSYGALAVGSSAGGDLTLTNAGTSPVIGLSFTITGEHAADFATSSTVPGDLHPGHPFVLGVGFSPKGVGPRGAALHITTSGPGGGTFIIALRGEGFLTDGHDEDGDGLGDLAESKLTGLGFDWRTADTEKIAALLGNAHLAGLFRAEEIHTLRAEPPAITRTGSETALSLFLKQSADGAAWTPIAPAAAAPDGDGGVEVALPATGGAKLLKMEAR